MAPLSFCMRCGYPSSTNFSFVLSVQPRILGDTWLNLSQLTEANSGLAEVFLTCVLLTSTVKQCSLDSSVGCTTSHAHLIPLRVLPANGMDWRTQEAAGMENCPLTASNPTHTVVFIGPLHLYERNFWYAFYNNRQASLEEITDWQIT